MEINQQFYHSTILNCFFGCNIYRYYKVWRETIFRFSPLARKRDLLEQTQPVCNRILLQITETRNGKTFSSVAWNIDTTIIGVTLHLISTFSTVSCNRVCSGSAACSITRCSSPSVCLSGTHSGGPGFRTRGSVGASRWICSVWGAAVSKLSMNLLCSSLRLPARCTAIVYFAPRWEDRLTLRDKWGKMHKWATMHYSNEMCLLYNDFRSKAERVLLKQ